MRFFVALEVLFLVIVADCDASMHNEFYCFMTDPIRPMTYMLASETSYEAVRRFNFTTFNPHISTCTTPSRFWFLGRYGGRFPNYAYLVGMQNFANSSIQADINRNYEAGRTTLCKEDFEAIRDWTMPANFTMENAFPYSLVTHEGILATQNIAKRFQQRFPQILTETYSPDRFLFRHSDTQRDNDTIRAFASGLFGESGSQYVIYEDIPEVDKFLRAFDNCPEFIEGIEFWNPSQRLAFQDGPEFQQMAEEINRKLGLVGSSQLNFQTILQMYNWCLFETSSNYEFSNSETGPVSPWCAAFSVAHHRLIEYSKDLYSFHTCGHGVRNQPLMQSLVCGLMRDLLTHVQSDDNRTSRIFVTFFEELMGMLVTLGAFRDTWPLHQHNFGQKSERQWLTSLVSPFGSNLSVIRYDCDDGDHDLLILVNEKPILIPGCDQQTGVCKVSVLVNRMQRFADADCETLYCSTN